MTITYLSPRIRADYLLLIESPTDRECLSAFATESGVVLCRDYANIVSRAAAEFPELPNIIGLPAEFVAWQVGEFLDFGVGAVQTGETLPVDGLVESEHTR
jgi:hypothetical protein